MQKWMSNLMAGSELKRKTEEGGINNWEATHSSKWNEWRPEQIQDYRQSFHIPHFSSPHTLLRKIIISDKAMGSQEQSNTTRNALYDLWSLYYRMEIIQYDKCCKNILALKIITHAILNMLQVWIIYFLFVFNKLFLLWMQSNSNIFSLGHFLSQICIKIFHLDQQYEAHPLPRYPKIQNLS